MEEKVEKLLSELAERVGQPVRPELADDIKSLIPSRIIPHTMDTINIIVDLRVNKWAAAAAIVVTLILLTSLLGGADSAGDNIYRDGQLLMNYVFGWGGASKSEMLAVKSKYECLIQEGIKAVYFGDKADLNDADSVLLQWKLPDGRYEVIFGDLHKETVTAEELITLQVRMLQNRINK
jgi:hypothetical protein